MKENYCVYKHTSPSGKVYIGITGNRPKRRWQNGQGYISNEYFTNAINKYGWENFTHEILFKNISKEEAEDIEIRLIKQYKSTNRKYGYNHAIGGGVNKGYKLSEATKKKLSELKKGENNWCYGKHLSKETRKKISESRLGEKNWLYGKDFSKEHREKISNALKGKSKPPRTQEHIKHLKEATKHIYQAVECIETGVVYESLREAERQTGILRVCITAVCKGKQKKAGGYTWRFA